MYIYIPLKLNLLSPLGGKAGLFDLVELITVLESIRAREIVVITSPYKCNKIMIIIIIEPVHEKTNNLGWVRHKPGCTSTEDG